MLDVLELPDSTSEDKVQMMADTSKSVASLFPVQAASPRKWVPRPALDGKMDWGFLSWALEALYGDPVNDIPSDPLDCVVYFIVANRAPDGAGKTVFQILKKLYPTWDDLMDAGPEGLPSLLPQPCVSDICTRDIVDALDRIKQEMGSFALQRVARLSNAKCLTLLASLPGMSRETASRVMMHALGRRMFPLDPDCTRVLTRLGIVENGLGHCDVEDKLVRVIPRNHLRSLHTNLILHGRNRCTPEDPDCAQCPVRKFCRYFRSLALQTAAKENHKPTVVDLFSGAGGTSFGLTRAGYRIIAAVEHDSWACQSFLLNHPEISPERVLCQDIEKLKKPGLQQVIKKDNVDLMVGGPPCQGFSMIGKRVRGLNGKKRFIDDPRNKLYKHFVRYVRLLRPKIVLMENVPGLFSLKKGHYRKQILEDLNHRYETRALLVDACMFGVPQRRQRALFVGVSKGHFGEKAKEIVGEIVTRLEALEKTCPSLKDAISDLPELEQDDGAEITRRADPKPEISNYAAEMGVRKELLIFNHVSRPLNSRDQLLYARLSPGETGHDAVEKHGARNLMVYRDDVFHDKYRRLVYGGPAPTIVAHLAKDGHMFIHPDTSQNRSITVREAARIQSFPDDFIFYGPRTHQFQQVGNAVPPLLAEEIGNIISSAVQEAGYVW